jgi:hypothetical protein
MDDDSMGQQEIHDDKPEKWWARLLCGLASFGNLVTPSAPVDPVVEIGLVSSHSAKDTSIISAYYLSFYE